MTRQSLAEFVGGFAARGNEIAYVQRQGYRRVRWTYAQLGETAARFARELEERGIGAGDRVFLWGPNSAEWVAAFTGCLLRGAVAVPMDFSAAPDFAARVASQVQARLAVISNERSLPPSAAMHVLELENLTTLLARHSGQAYPAPPLNREAIAEILFTSGTTSEPKGVAISHGNILANLEPLEIQILKYKKYERYFHPLRFLNVVPLSHVFGQFMGVFVPSSISATVVFGDSLNPAEILRTIHDERVSLLIAVPRVIESLATKIERDIEAGGQIEKFRHEYAEAAKERFIWHMWRFRKIHRRFGWKFWAFLSGGAALPAETEEFWNRLGFAVIQGYGLTETTSLVSVNHPFKIGRGSIGKILDGREVKLDEKGEILVRGKSVAAGYWDATGLHPLADGDEGWYHTGDLGSMDAEGSLYFRGRSKDVIVTPAGMNVYPADLEAALRHQPEVVDCLVFGLEDGGNAEPFAVLLLRASSADAAAVVERANATLAEFQHIRRWWVWPDNDFPRTGTGKPQAATIRRAAEAAISGKQQRVSGQATEAILSEIVGRARTATAAPAPEPARPDGTDAKALGLDSLGRVELLGALEDRYQVELDQTKFAEARTVGDLQKLIGEAKPAGEKPQFVYSRWPQRWPITWIRAAIYYMLTWPATHLMAHPRVYGRENLRGVRGPLLIVANHQMDYDVGFVLAALTPRLRYRMATAMWGERLVKQRHPPKEWFFFRRWLWQIGYYLMYALFNVFPLPKSALFRDSFRFAASLAERGYSILIFPEGDETPDGTMKTFRPGIGLLVNDLRLPVLPMRVEGLYAIRLAGTRWNRPGRVQVYVGKPIYFPEPGEPHEIAKKIEDAVAALGPRDNRGGPPVSTPSDQKSDAMGG
ncbi:MAG: AMP-binding protein [Candidatus Acidiferrales bacterium]